MRSLQIMTTHKDVIHEIIQYSHITDHFAVTTPAEKSEMIMNALFVEYPTLKPSTKEKEYKVKKSFMEFLDVEKAQKKEIVSGTPSQHKELSKLLKEFTPLVKNEFEQWKEHEQNDFGNITDYVIHKLCIHEVLKVYQQKKVHYRRDGLTDYEKFQLSMLMGATYANEWGIDPSEIVKEWNQKLNPDLYEV